MKFLSKKWIYSFTIIMTTLLLIVSSCKNENVAPQEEDLEFDPPLSEEMLQVLEDASVNYDDYLDSLIDINGKTYREIFSDPNWASRMDSIKGQFRISALSIDQKIKGDIDDMLKYGGSLIWENEQDSASLPALSQVEPAQRAYAYTQVFAQNRQIVSRAFPELGNDIFKQYKLRGTDCSGFLYFLLKSVGFTNANFSFGGNTFQTKVVASVSEHYNANAELINLGGISPFGGISPSELKRGDFMVWPEHGAIIDKPGANPLAYQSNGTPSPKNEADHKKNYAYNPGPGPQRRGISAKDYNWLKKHIRQSITIWRIVPIIDRGEIQSGNEQQGNENQILSQPLKVKVLDKTGYGIEDARVVFSVVSGGGEIIGASELETDDEGIAEIQWKLGTEVAGEQKLEAKVKKFTGEDIGASTLIFTAEIIENTFTDPRDGQIYQTVIIGSQQWFAENLNYAAGNSWCYGESLVNCNTYGRLYDWQTATNACPTGWHLPTNDEWTELKDFLGGAVLAGGKMKEAGLDHWSSPNTGGTNESGFTGLPGGVRAVLGDFQGLGNSGTWWSATEINSQNAGLIYNSATVTGYSQNKAAGISVRCVRD